MYNSIINLQLLIDMKQSFNLTQLNLIKMFDKN